MSNRRKGRNKLYSYFLKGRIPTQEDFEQFIDSTVNIYDDKVYRNKNEKGKNESFLIGGGAEGELLAFFRDLDDSPIADWLVKFGKDNQSLHIGQPDLPPALFLKANGGVGIGTDDPKFSLDVRGSMGMESRVGQMAQGTVPGDGNWHDLMKGLDGYHALEVVAWAGKKGSHSMIHAIALNVYAGRKGTISLTRNCMGGCRYRLQLRWIGDNRNYSLQIRSRSNFGGASIQFHITGLLPGKINPAQTGYPS